MRIFDKYEEIRIEKTFWEYIDSITIYLNGKMVGGPLLEEFRRAIESGMGISEMEADDFRRTVGSLLGQPGRLNWRQMPNITFGICKYLKIENIYAPNRKYRSIDDPWITND